MHKLLLGSNRLTDMKLLFNAMFWAHRNKNMWIKSWYHYFEIKDQKSTPCNTIRLIFRHCINCEKWSYHYISYLLLAVSPTYIIPHPHISSFQSRYYCLNKIWRNWGPKVLVTCSCKWQNQMGISVCLSQMLCAVSWILQKKTPRCH